MQAVFEVELCLTGSDKDLQALGVYCTMSIIRNPKK